MDSRKVRSGLTLCCRASYVECRRFIAQRTYSVLRPCGATEERTEHEDVAVGQKKLRRKPYRRRRWRSYLGFRGMTLRDWLPIFIAAAIPILIFFGTRSITLQQADLEAQRAQDAVLQAYLSQMGSLLLEEDLRDSERGSEVRTLARARTLTVLERLDPGRRTEAMQFLDEANLVHTTPSKPKRPVISLEGADLSGTDLFNANFTGAKLEEADLSGTDLRRAYLRDAWLVFTDLSGADLENAVLSGVHLHVVDFSGADLRGAQGISGQELAAYGCVLEGTTLPDGRTMPSGQAYEDLTKAGKEGK